MATAGWRATTGVSPSLMAGELERCLLICIALFNIDNNFHTNQANIQRTKSDGVPNKV